MGVSAARLNVEREKKNQQKHKGVEGYIQQGMGIFGSSTEEQITHKSQLR